MAKPTRVHRGTLIISFALLLIFSLTTDTPAEEATLDTLDDSTSSEDSETSDESEEREDDDHPGIILGVGVGTGIHRFTSRPIDAVTGASNTGRGSSDIDVGFTARVVADFGFVDAGPGDFGMITYFDFSAPVIYWGAGWGLRYRMEFNLSSRRLLSIAPSIGVGVFFAFTSRIESDFYLNFSLPLGLDFQVFVPNLYFTIAADLHAGCPVGTTVSTEVGGVVEEVDWRYKSYVVTLGVSYRVF